MENIENMNEGMENVVNEIVADEAPGMGKAMGIVIGVGLTIAVVTAGVKLAKKAYDAYKAHKELRKPDHDVAVTDEDLENVTAK